MEWILALGFVVTLLVGNKAPTPDPVGVKKWESSTLTPEALTSLVNKESCGPEERDFLSCAAAVDEMGQALQMDIEPDGSYVLPQEELYQSKRLKKWKSAFFKKERVDFEKIIKKILSSVDKKHHKFMVASGINGYLSIKEDPHTYIEPFPEPTEVLSFDDFKEEVDVFNVLEEKPQTPSPLQKEEEIIGGEVRILINHRLEEPSLLTIDSFKENTCVKTFWALQKVKKAKVTNLALDLKDNPGGLVYESVCVASLFLGKKKIVTLRPFHSPEEVFTGKREKIYEGKLRVLIGNGTASAAEILTGALKFYEAAEIIGNTTYGKGTFQNIQESPFDKYAVRLRKTSGFYYLPDNSCPQLKGIEPHKYEEDIGLYDREEGFLYPLQPNYVLK